MPVRCALLPEPPADWAEAYRRLVLRDLAFDFRIGFAISTTDQPTTVTKAGCLRLTNTFRRGHDRARSKPV